jgi:hypothetical protein
MKQQYDDENNDDENNDDELVDLNNDDDASDFEVTRVWIAKFGEKIISVSHFPRR